MTRRADRRRAACASPYVLLTADSEAEADAGVPAHSHHSQFVDAINAFVHNPAPYKTIVYDDGHQVRDLNAREEALLKHACSMLGVEVEYT